MLEREVDGRRTGRIVRHRDNLIQLQLFNNRLQIPKLLLEAVAGVDGLVGLTETEEIEGHNPMPRSGQIGHKLVIDMQIVRKTMHENKGWPLTRVVTDVDVAVLTLNLLLNK